MQFDLSFASFNAPCGLKMMVSEKAF